MAAVAGKGARRGTGGEEGRGGRGGRGREGETAARDEIVVAVGVNCSDPDYIEVSLCVWAHIGYTTPTGRFSVSLNCRVGVV